MMPIHDPQVPYQDNSWDCGVFVCRYAYSTLRLRKQQFTFEDITGNEILQERISNNTEFNFNMQDIKALRKEIKILIDNLAKLYQSIKSKEKENRKAEKRKAKMLTNSINEPGGGVIVKTVINSSTVNKDQSKPKNVGKLATMTEDVVDHYTKDELASTTPIMIEDKEIEGNTSGIEYQHQRKEVNPNNNVAANKVDKHDDNENESEVEMVEGENKVGRDASPMEERDLRENDCAASLLEIKVQDRSKALIPGDIVTANKVSDHDEHEEDINHQTVEEYNKARAGVVLMIKKEDLIEEEYTTARTCDQDEGESKAKAQYFSDHVLDAEPIKIQPIKAYR